MATEGMIGEATPLTWARRLAGERDRLAPGEVPVAWKVNCETATLLGWGPAILLQLAHPLVAAGVADHSVAVSHPELRLRRLGQTVAAMLAIIFGDEVAVTRAAAAINAIHDRVYGELTEAAGVFPAGTRYSAHDPALLAWVHATLVAMLPRAYELFVGPLTAEERDRYCAEATGMGPLLGIPADLMPRTAAELRRYLDGQIAAGVLAPSPAARALAREIVAPRTPRWGRLLGPLVALPTVGLLPPAVRAAYGFRWTRGHEVALRALAWCFRRTIPWLPAVLHRWPAARVAMRSLGTD